MKKTAALPGSRECEPIELMPDAWERFERAVNTVSKSGPKHRPSATRTKAKAPAPELTKANRGD